MSVHFSYELFCFNLCITDSMAVSPVLTSHHFDLALILTEHPVFWGFD